MPRRKADLSALLTELLKGIRSAGRWGFPMAALRSCGYCLALLLACLAAADATTSAPSALPSPLPAPLPTPLPTPHWYLRGATDAPTAAPTGTRRCSWDRVKTAECYFEDQTGEKIYIERDARAQCEALDHCDGYMYPGSGFYQLCRFNGKKDGCGRLRIARVESAKEGEGRAVFMCRPYDATPAWRDPVAFWLCLCIAVLVFPICFCVSWHLLEQVFEQKDGYVATYGTSQVGIRRSRHAHRRRGRRPLPLRQRLPRPFRKPSPRFSTCSS